MRLSCNVIKDLLILYEDDACSEDGVQLIEEHLSNCPECRSYLENLRRTEEIISEEIKEKLLPEDKIIKHSFKKIRRRWMTSIAAVFMLIPLAGLGIMGYHETRNEGIAFSNLDDIYRCRQYLKYIEDEEFEKAAEMIDFSQNEYTLVNSVAEMTMDEYQAYMKERFITKLREYAELGLSIDNISYSSSYRAKGDSWCICISFDENYPDGTEQRIIVHMNGDTMYVGARSYPDTGEVRQDDYIDEILRLYSEDDPLDYRDMEVTFVLEEGEKAIISGINENEGSLASIGLFNISYGTGRPLIRESYPKDSFIASVPGEYSICGVKSQGDRGYLTADEVEIQIIKYN